MDLDAAVRSAQATAASIQRMPGMFMRAWWPHSCCDLASYVIGQLLLEQGLGDWWVVCWGNSEEMGGHTWLEWREDDEPIFILDATLHQFEEFDTPYFGAAPSPAVERFERLRDESPLSQFKFFNEKYTETLEWVRADVSGSP